MNPTVRQELFDLLARAHSRDPELYLQRQRRPSAIARSAYLTATLEGRRVALDRLERLARERHG